MMCKFEGIPQTFIDLHRPQFVLWAREFKTRGPMVQLELYHDPRMPVPMNPDPVHGPVRPFVVLEAIHQTHARTGEERMVIKPHSDADVEKIERYVREMGRYVLQ